MNNFLQFDHQRLMGIWLGYLGTFLLSLFMIMFAVVLLWGLIHPKWMWATIGEIMGATEENK